MIDLLETSEDDSERFQERVSNILKTVSPAMRSDMNVSVRLNVLAIQLASIMQEIPPDQLTEFSEAFTSLTALHESSMRKRIPSQKIGVFALLIERLFQDSPDDATTH